MIYVTGNVPFPFYSLNCLDTSTHLLLFLFLTLITLLILYLCVNDLAQFSCWQIGLIDPPFSEKLSISDVMLGKDIKLKELGLWGCTRAPKYTVMLLFIVYLNPSQSYRPSPDRNSFESSFRNGSNPEKGAKKEGIAVQFLDIWAHRRLVVLHEFDFENSTHKKESIGGALILVVMNYYSLDTCVDQNTHNILLYE